MSPKVKIGAKIFSAFLLAATTLIVSLFVIETSFYPLRVTAQAPVDLSSAFTKSQLQALGLDLATLEAANSLPYDLAVVKTTGITQVNAGQLVTFTITITNQGSNPVSYIFFYDDYPSQMQNVTYLFNKTAISNGLAKPTWLLPDSIVPGGKVLVTVTGILTSSYDVTVKNTATVSAFNSTGETDTQNNSSFVTLDINGSSPGPALIYLPLVSKAPQLTLIYLEYFNDNNGWVEFDDFNGCTSSSKNGQYRVDVDRKDRECLPFAPNNPKPEVPNRTYGEFEVAAYHSEDINDSDNILSDADYGLFINGAGGDNQYIFKISPNNTCSSGGDWQLIRKKSGNRTVLIQGVCNAAIKRGGNINILRIAHDQNHKLSVYANGFLLGSVVEVASNVLTGVTTGVYVLSGDKDLRVIFDDFKVYKYQ